MSTRKALTFSFVDRYAGLIVHTATAMVIARLLTPGEIGIYSVSMVLVGFVATFRDLGAGQYLVQKHQLELSDSRAVWAVQFGLGLLFATLVASASLPVASFYREPRIAGIMMVVAISFAITPFAAFHYAWLMREMRFGALALVRVTGAIGNAIFAVGLAISGFGPISLALASLAATVVSILVIGFVSRAKLPWTGTTSSIRKVVTFGGQLTIVTLLTTITQAAPELLLGRLQGMTETGLFSRGMGLVGMFERLVTDASNAVAMPYFAKQMREGKALDEPFLHACALITALGWSFVGCLGIL
ncbi:MAG: oligosaccharide flippase family protein, partial [Bryobacteraceae bacterium]